METKVEKKVKDSKKWHDGPPPHVGWWNASRTKKTVTWRWWDGNQWSSAVTVENPRGSESDYDELSVAFAANRPAYEGGNPIQYRLYYPKNARVPRVDPAKAVKLPKLKLVA